MLGVIAGNIRGIALPTLVTLLVPEHLRDRANGLVGTTTGVSFLVTSVISGLLVAFDGMRSTIVLAMVVSAASFVHLAGVRIEERRVVTTGDGADGGHGVDLKGTLRVVRVVPGLLALIAFSCFNNFIGGAFMAVMDPYGLSLVSLRAWGLLWGLLSAGVIIGGLLITRTGVGANPVRTLLLVNLVLWTVCIVFPLRSPGPRHGAGVHRHGHDRAGRHRAGPGQPPVPAAVPGVHRARTGDLKIAGSRTPRRSRPAWCAARRDQTATSATSAASAAIRAQSPAATASAGVSHEPPTQPTF